MVFDDKVVDDQVLTLPCGVEYVGASKNNLAKFEESRSGLLIFSSASNNKLCYILSTFTPDLATVGKKTRLAFEKGHNNYIKAILRLSQKYITIRGSPIIAWKCKPFAKVHEAIFKPKEDWKLVSKEDENVSSESVVLSWFILYQSDYSDVSRLNFTELRSHASSICVNIDMSTTQAVETRSHPFGPDVIEIFSSAVSTGVISNVSDDQSLFLIDARCLPGSEGGSVLTENLKQLIGIIVAPLCWKNQELVGFAVCCSIQTVLSSLHDVLPQNSNIRFLTESIFRSMKSSDIQIQRSREPTVVRIDVGDIWGSGVIVAATHTHILCEIIVVTCRHVIEHAIKRKLVHINVIFEDGERYTGTLLFATDEESAYDLALLTIKVDEKFLDKLWVQKVHIPNANKDQTTFVVPYSERFIKCSPVHVKGYPLFDSDINLKSTVCSGVLSNVLYSRTGAPILLHSSCLVHKGSSGGGLICSRTGKLQGIVVNHVKDELGNISYPDVNFSIPCNIFMPVIEDYLFTGRDLNILKRRLNCFDNSIKKTWDLDPVDLTNENGKLVSKL